MNKWFECVVKCTKVDETTGKNRKVSERYLVDAVNFTEAETRIISEMNEIISGEFTVKAVKEANYTDVLPFASGDRWYKTKISFISVDEEGGKEKKVSNNILIVGGTVKEAYDNLKQSLSDMTVDFDIVSISESPILDIFPYYEPDSQ